MAAAPGGGGFRGGVAAGGGGFRPGAAGRVSPASAEVVLRVVAIKVAAGRAAAMAIVTATVAAGSGRA